MSTADKTETKTTEQATVDQPVSGLVCEDCGCDNANETICPYEEEINMKSVDCNLCEDCYHERCMEI